VIKKALMLFPVFAGLAVAAMLFGAAPSAQAALDGENGPILYITETEPVNPTNPETDFVKPQEIPVPEPENAVVTTAPDGTADVVADTSTDKITSATISAPTTENNYDIVFATKDNQTQVCNNNREVRRTCDPNKVIGSEAVLNKITIDENRNPVAGTEESKTLVSLKDNLFDKELPYNWVYQTSYSPDGSQVLVTQAASWQNPEKSSSIPVYTSLILVDTKNFASGPVTTVVKSAIDPCLSGAFADNGAIYYSTCKNLMNPNILYFDTSSTISTSTPKKLNNEFKNNLYPYFIDVSPDNSVVLFANLAPSKGSFICLYGHNVLYTKLDKSAINCSYYYGSASGNSKINELSKANLNVDFVPKFFSPDGKYIIGTVFPQNFLSRSGLLALQAVNTNEPYTAAFSTADYSLTPVSNMIGVQEWGPLAFATPNEPGKGSVVVASVTPTTTSQATLPNTGVSLYALIATALGLMLLAGYIGLSPNKQ
jgi:hypothetical protein